MKRARKKPAAAKKARKGTKLRVSRADAELMSVIAASAKVLRLNIKKGWQPQVLANLKVTLQHAARVAEFRLPEDIEPAPVFKA